MTLKQQFSQNSILKQTIPTHAYYPVLAHESVLNNSKTNVNTLFSII